MTSTNSKDALSRVSALAESVAENQPQSLCKQTLSERGTPRAARSQRGFRTASAIGTCSHSHWSVFSGCYCIGKASAADIRLLLVRTAVQTVLDALRARKDRFHFEGSDMVLRNSVMAFITMNPGYPGRAELPESLKVGRLGSLLSRPRMEIFS
jgi:hypothetical protein